MHEKHPQLPTNLLLMMSELDRESKAFTARTLLAIGAVGEDKKLLFDTERNTNLWDAIT